MEAELLLGAKADSTVGELMVKGGGRGGSQRDGGASNKGSGGS